MYANKLVKTGAKTEKQLIFTDADAYTIPASEGWNEGYSHSNKFLYIANAGLSGKNIRTGASRMTSAK